MNILVSIIIPVYRSELTLPKCLESINDQAFNLFEVLIVDSEDSLEIQAIARIQKAQYFNLEVNNIATKRNYGASQAKGQILLFLDSDCILPDHFFENLIEIFESKQVVAAGSHDFHLPLGSHWINEAWQVHSQVWSVHNTSWIPTRCLAVKLEAFKMINGFNEKLITCEDVDLGYRLNNYGQIVNSDLLKITHLTNPQNIGQFFLKEMWHGVDSLAMSIKNRSNLKELIYLTIPIYFIFIILISVFSLYTLFSDRALLPLVLLFIMLLPVLGMAFYTSLKGQRLETWLALSLAYFLYIMARGASVLISVFNGRIGRSGL